MFENFIIVLKLLDKHHELYYNGDRSNKTVMLEFFKCDSYVKTYDVLSYILNDKERNRVIEEMIKMNSNYVLYTDDERQIIDEMQQETNNALFFEEGIQQGVEKGVQQGFEKGIKEEKNKTIKNMLKNKFTLKQISLAINKPVKEIKEIAQTINI